MVTLNIAVSRAGIDKVVSDAKTTADIDEVGELLQVSSKAIRLLHESVWAHFQGGRPATLPALDEARTEARTEVKN